MRGLETYRNGSAAKSMTLYAGRWVHVAGVLANGQDGAIHWSNLSLYANGDRVGYTPYASWTTSPTGSAYLRLGWDQASGSSAGYFRSTVDEFRLYDRTLTQDAVRGLLWFAGGANNVVIPRGVLYDSLLFKQMTNTNSSDIMNGPLFGANVFGNSNTDAAHLNAQVVRMANREWLEHLHLGGSILYRA